MPDKTKESIARRSRAKTAITTLPSAAGRLANWRAEGLGAKEPLLLLLPLLLLFLLFFRLSFLLLLLLLVLPLLLVLLVCVLVLCFFLLSLL